MTTSRTSESLSPRPPARGRSTDARRSELRRWLLAGALTFLVHLGLLLGGRALRIFESEPQIARADDVLEVVFAPTVDESPTQFTELPPDRADDPPDHSDLLSNVDSRARDRAGGVGDVPRQDGLSESPQIRMDRGAIPTLASLESIESEDRPREEEERSEFEDSTPTPLGSSAAVETPLFGSRPQDPFAASRRAPASEPTPPGNSDIAQEASYTYVEGGALLDEDFSLSTTAWDYAPWVLHFRRQLTENWVAPMGYHLGLISGWTLVEVEVSLSGEIRQLQVLDESGHMAFRSASVGAIERSQPLLPLPAGFPDESLVLRIRLSYPDYVRQTQGVRRPSGRRGSGRR